LATPCERLLFRPSSAAQMHVRNTWNIQNWSRFSRVSLCFVSQVSLVYLKWDGFEWKMTRKSINMWVRSSLLFVQFQQFPHIFVVFMHITVFVPQSHALWPKIWWKATIFRPNIDVWTLERVNSNRHVDDSRPFWRRFFQHNTVTPFWTGQTKWDILQFSFLCYFREFECGRVTWTSPRW